jgi:hypothetical protein
MQKLVAASTRQVIQKVETSSWTLPDCSVQTSKYVIAGLELPCQDNLGAKLTLSPTRLCSALRSTIDKCCCLGHDIQLAYRVSKTL